MTACRSRMQQRPNEADHDEQRRIARERTRQMVIAARIRLEKALRALESESRCLDEEDAL